jgi:hypothetical protein
MKRKNMATNKRLERVNAVTLSKTVYLKSELTKQNYTLTNITNHYETTNLSNT